MWYLIEDFFEQSWVMKLFILWGWLSAAIMVASLPASVTELAKLLDDTSAHTATQSLSEDA